MSKTKSQSDFGELFLFAAILFLAFTANCAETNSASVAMAADSTNNWKLVWSDEFDTNGAPNPANWNYERGFVRNNELQWYQPENAFCTNGLLVIEARSEHKRNPNFVAGSD